MQYCELRSIPFKQVPIYYKRYFNYASLFVFTSKCSREKYILSKCIKSKWDIPTVINFSKVHDNYNYSKSHIKFDVNLFFIFWLKNTSRVCNIVLASSIYKTILSYHTYNSPLLDGCVAAYRSGTNEN